MLQQAGARTTVGEGSADFFRGDRDAAGPASGLRTPCAAKIERALGQSGFGRAGSNPIARGAARMSSGGAGATSAGGSSGPSATGKSSAAESAQKDEST